MIRFLLWFALAYVLLTVVTTLLRFLVRPRAPDGPRAGGAPEPAREVEEARWEEIPDGSREDAPRSKGEP